MPQKYTNSNTFQKSITLESRWKIYTISLLRNWFSRFMAGSHWYFWIESENNPVTHIFLHFLIEEESTVALLERITKDYADTISKESLLLFEDEVLFDFEMIESPPGIELPSKVCIARRSTENHVLTVHVSSSMEEFPTNFKFKMSAYDPSDTRYIHVSFVYCDSPNNSL